MMELPQTHASSSATKFPPVRACIFDMDGLLINSEDIITQATNRLLAKYGRPAFTRSIRVQIMGIPDSTNGDVFHNWAKLPISRHSWAREFKEQMQVQFQSCEPLPGAEKLVSDLSRAHNTLGDSIRIALATSSESQVFQYKTSTPKTKRLLDFFRPDQRILGDDARLRPGRGKPAPDMYLLALESLNLASDENKNPIVPEECLVFEDSVVGVEAGRRAGMRIIWVPHPDVAAEYEEDKQNLVLARRTGENKVEEDWQLGQINDGWAEVIPSLVFFDYKKCGISL